MSRESISEVESIVAKNGDDSMDCKLFEVNHEDINCENFDIVASKEICNGTMPYPDWPSVRDGVTFTRYVRFEELNDILPLLQAQAINLEILGWAFPDSKVAFYDQELDLHNGHLMSWAGRDQLGGVRTGFSRFKNFFVDDLTCKAVHPDVVQSWTE